MQEKLLSMFAAGYVEIFGEPPDPIVMETPLADLDIESLDFIEISMQIEDEFDVTLESDRFAEVRTVGDAIEAFAELIADRDRASRA